MDERVDRRDSLQPGRRAAGHAARPRPALAATRTRACVAVRVDATSCRRAASSLLPEDVADTALYGCIVPDSRARARASRATSASPWPPWPRPTPRAAARRAELPRGRLRRAARRLRARSARSPRARRWCTTSTSLRGAAGDLDGLRPGGGNVLPPLPARCTAAARPGFDEADVVVEGEWTCAGAAHAPLEPHACAAEWSDGRLTVWTGTQTPFNVRARARRGVRRSTEGDVRVVVAADGRQLRRQDVHAASRRSPPRWRARPAGRCASCCRATRSSSRSCAIPRASACGSAPGATARSWRAACGPSGTRARTPTPARTSPRRAAGPPSARTASTTSRSTRSASTRTRPPAGAFRGYAATQAVWASEQCVDLLAERARRRPARAAAAQRAARRRPLRDRRDDARLPRRGVPRARRRAHRLERGQARQGPVRADEGHADAEPLPRPRIELVEGALHGRERDDRHRPGARPDASRQLAAAALGCDAAIIDTAGVDTDSSPFDTRTTSSRSTHMMAGALGNAARELRAAHRRRARGRSPATCCFVGDAVEIVGSPGTRRALADARRRSRARASGRSTAGSTPRRGRASPRRTGTRAPAAVEVARRRGDRLRRDRRPRGRGLRGPRRRRRRAPRCRTTARS